ncbi:hypothetical protein EYF80_044255 [Liparis tanakae]|uniref:Uncharacterized protein n=1 Tax=Liparis tanakae TaxID=230148 RepID=A0A4Z2FWF9_9TELE|nr:hypothetical protein EYF80_044255 [Liparis tanakae]
MQQPPRCVDGSPGRPEPTADRSGSLPPDGAVRHDAGYVPIAAAGRLVTSVYRRPLWVRSARAARCSRPCGALTVEECGSRVRRRRGSGAPPTGQTPDHLVFWSSRGRDVPAEKPVEAPWIHCSQRFFLAFGESYFLLLEYQRSSGMPMEGSVITPNAAQSS